MENNTTTAATADGTMQNFFAGSIPQSYDTYMGPILFTPYALDLIPRMKLSGPVRVLELACGTGRVTKHILEVLPEGSEFIASDISQDMINVAKENIAAPISIWQVADMSQTPYSDGEFDIVICQFGLMFVPDKVKALKEMLRVLKPGGQLLFNTWGPIEENPMWQISFATFNAIFGEMPIPQGMGPFGLPDENFVLDLMVQAGFENSKAEKVRKTSQVETAALAAKGFLLTSAPLAKKPELFPLMQQTLEKNLSDKLGDNPLNTSLLALVFEATK